MPNYSKRHPKRLYRSVILIMAETGDDCLYSIVDITTKLVCSYEKFCQN